MKQLNLLPNYYKKIAFVLIIAAITTTIIAFQFKTGPYLYLLKSAVKTLVIIAGLCLIFSKEKIEDEMTQLIRLRAISFAFIMSVIIYLIDESHILDYFGTAPVTTFRFITSVEFWYLIYFYVLRNPMNLRRNKLKPS